MAKNRQCIICGKPIASCMSWSRIINHKTIYFCDHKCRENWHKRTTIGEYNINGKSVISDVTVKIFSDDGNAEISNPDATPLIEITLNVMRFDKMYSKGVTRKNHTFYWEGKIPDKFKALNLNTIEAKIIELISKATS